MYVVVALLFIAGLHVPEIPLFDVVGSVKELPAHIGEMVANVGVTLGFTVTVNVAVVPH